MIIAGTGHRPNKLWSYNLSNPNYSLLLNLLIQYFEKYQPDKVVSGMALGFDTVLALAVLQYNKIHDKKILLECAIPCKNQESRWNEKDQEFYHRILEMADIITYVSDREYTSSCMQLRNIYMVDLLKNPEDRLLGLWNGTAGGTSNCLDYACGKGIKNIDILNPKTWEWRNL